jgi:hypothetical protein
VTWNLRDASGSRVPPGVYFIDLRMDLTRATRRIVVLE